MKAILDASFILDFLLPDENSPRVRRVFEEYANKKIDFLAPVILPFEVVNGLKFAVKSKRIEKEDAPKFLAKFLEFDIHFIDIDLAGILELAFDEDLSTYDASYVWLAKEKGLPLLTLDKKLKKISK